MTIAVDLGRKATKPTNQPTMLSTVSSFAFCFVKIRLAHNQSRSVSKTSLNARLHGFSGMAFTCIHDDMVVTVTVT